MMFTVVVLTVVVGIVFGDDPIVLLKGNCPDVSTQEPSLHLTADVPAYALAKCRNGDKELEAEDKVNFALPGSFSQVYIGTRCQFFKKDGSNTYTVDVEVGWGEPDSQIVQQRKIHTISCAYDAHGKALSETETINDWFLNPWEAQSLLGGNSSATFNLLVMDVLNEEITTDHISIGRKIQLQAEDTSGKGKFFRALSCSVENDEGRYYILRAGCGDGLVFPKISGFVTQGGKVFSPYFDAFKLHGEDNTVEFQCRFTECDGPCDGDSCSHITGQSVPKRMKRSELEKRPIVIATSKFFNFRI